MASKRRFGGRSTTDDVLEGVDIGDRIILVTGANAGIGFETARALAAHGARVVLACRTDDNAQATAERIRAAHPNAKLDPLVCALDSLAAVEEAAAAFPADHLDALIANAGVYGGGYAETVDGIERTVGVCHFGHALLVQRLRDKIESCDGRVVMAASGSHQPPPRLDFDRYPLSAAHYSDLVAYGQAKLCNVLFANELQRRYGRRGLTANALHPGALIATSIGRSSGLAKLAITLFRPFSKTLAQGAATSAYVATAPELDGVGGKYFQDAREHTASPEARSPEVARRLWERTEEIMADRGFAF
jgi:WW domain-containing oxidoreductase